MIFASPVEEGLATGTFYDQLATPFYLSPDKVEGDYSPVRFARELKLFRRFCPKGRVLEHLVSPREFLARTAAVLEPSGFCFVLVPNFQSLAVRLLGKKYRYVLPQHVNYFTRATLHQLVKMQPGFRIVYSGSTHFNPLVIWQDWRRCGAPVSDEDRVKLLKRTTGYKQNPFLKPLKLMLAGAEAGLKRWHLADNLVVVLQKIAT